VRPTSTAAAPANSARLYVARQPILSGNEQVFGYELLFRDGVEDYFRHTDADTASRSTLDTSILMGLDVLCDGRRAFLNCTRETLLKDYVTLLPPAQVVIEILESVPVDDLVKAACVRLNIGNLSGEHWNGTGNRFANDLDHSAPGIPLRRKRSLGKDEIKTTAHYLNDPGTPHPRLQRRTGGHCTLSGVDFRLREDVKRKHFSTPLRETSIGVASKAPPSSWRGFWF
jgi:hypothetical protein